LSLKPLSVLKNRIHELRKARGLTVEELATANRTRKPILVHSEQGKAGAPDWLFGMIPHEMIFSTWAELYAYLRHINNDPDVDTLGRWVFFGWHGTEIIARPF
jgi:transcriptional regulator with XRE-family HTH domain